MPVPQGWLFFSQSTFLLFHQPPLMADRLSTASATGKESDFSITRTAFISSRKRWPDLPRPRACACPHGHTSTGCRSQLFRLSHINRCIQASPALRGPEHYRFWSRRPLKNRFARIDQTELIAQIIRQRPSPDQQVGHVLDAALPEGRGR